MCVGKSQQRIIAWIVATLVYDLCAGGVWAACSDSVATVATDTAKVRFQVELAITAQDKVQGLMHREILPDRAGMLFIYPNPQPVSFWMRNTLIPLDMIFIDDQGRVARVHHNAVPLDETPIYGGDAIKAVLEINAGLAKKYGISDTSTVMHPLISPEFAQNCK
jgi:uncharacterized membrane protein (UPF0127 family)